MDDRSTGDAAVPTGPEGRDDQNDPAQARLALDSTMVTASL